MSYAHKQSVTAPGIPLTCLNQYTINRGAYWHGLCTCNWQMISKDNIYRKINCKIKISLQNIDLLYTCNLNYCLKNAENKLNSMCFLWNQNTNIWTIRLISNTIFSLLFPKITDLRFFFVLTFCICEVRINLLKGG